MAIPTSPFSELNAEDLEEVLSSDTDEVAEPGSPDTAANSDEPATPHESPRPSHAGVAAAKAAAENEGEGGASGKEKASRPPARPPQRRSATRSKRGRGAAAKVGEGAHVNRGGRI